MKYERDKAINVDVSARILSNSEYEWRAARCFRSPVRVLKSARWSHRYASFTSERAAMEWLFQQRLA